MADKPTPIQPPVAAPPPSDINALQSRLLQLQIENLEVDNAKKQKAKEAEDKLRRQNAMDALQKAKDLARDQELCVHQSGFTAHVSVHRMPDGTHLVSCSRCLKTAQGTEHEMRVAFKGAWPPLNAIGFTVTGDLASALAQAQAQGQSLQGN